MTQSISAVVFDLDGTLFDHHGSALSGVRGLVEGLGAEFTDGLAAAWFAAEQRHVATWLAGECSWREQRHRRLQEFLPLLDPAAGPNIPESLDEIFEGYLSSYQQAWRAFDDAQPALLAVRQAGYAVGMLTNGQREQQLAKLERIGLLDLVGPVFTPGDLGVAKPDPEAFRTTCQRLNHELATTVYVGDDFRLDIEAAINAGLQAVYLDRDQVGPAGYVPRIAALDELLPTVTKLSAGVPS